MAKEPLKGKARHAWENALIQSVGKPSERHVLRALLGYAGGKPICWPSVGKLSHETGLGDRQVKRIIKELARGAVVVAEDGSKRTHRVFIFPSHPAAGPVLAEYGAGTPLRDAPEGDTSRRCGGDMDDTPRCAPRGDIHDAPRGDIRRRFGGGMGDTRILSMGTSQDKEPEPRSLPLSVVRYEDGDEESERDAIAHEEDGNGEEAWHQVWKGMVPPEDEWWTWPEDRATAYEVACHVAKEAGHMKPAADLVKTRPAMLTAKGASWRSVAAAIVRASWQDPARIYALPRYINTLALEHHGATPRPIEPHEADIIDFARWCNQGLRRVDRTVWMQGTLRWLLDRLVPEAGAAMAAVEALEKDRFDRMGPTAAAYAPVEEFVERARGLSEQLDRGGWRRLAEVARVAVASGTNDLPALDELLSRAASPRPRRALPGNGR